MKRKIIWLKENYQLVIAFILFFVLMFALTREGADLFDGILQKAIEKIKNIFV